MITITELGDCERVSQCAQLMELGARPVVAAEVTGVDRKSAIEMYRRIRRENPPRGMLPSSSEWFFVNRIRRLESSMLAAIYGGMGEGCGKTQRILDAYRHYESLCATAPAVNINRWVLLSRLIDRGDVEMAFCDQCDLHFLISEYEVMTGGPCPRCKGMKKGIASG